MLQPFLCKVDASHSQKDVDVFRVDQSRDGYSNRSRMERLLVFFMKPNHWDGKQLLSWLPWYDDLIWLHLHQVSRITRHKSKVFTVTLLCLPGPVSSWVIWSIRPRYVGGPLPARRIYSSHDIPRGPRWSGGYVWAWMTPTPAARLLPASCLLIGPQGWNRASLVPPCRRGGGWTWVCSGVQLLLYCARYVSHVSGLSLPGPG